jgi:hypothetical protein
MRPSFRGFLRLPCRTLARRGGGTGGVLMTTTLGLDDAAVCSDAEAIASMLESGLAIPAVSAAQLAVAAPDVPAVPFTIGGEMPDYPRDAVLMLEGYDGHALMAASAAIREWFDRSILAGARTAWTTYSLGYVVRRTDLPHVVAAGRNA